MVFATISNARVFSQVQDSSCSSPPTWQVPGSYNNWIFQPPFKSLFYHCAAEQLSLSVGPSATPPTAGCPRQGVVPMVTPSLSLQPSLCGPSLICCAVVTSTLTCSSKGSSLHVGVYLVTSGSFTLLC